MTCMAADTATRSPMDASYFTAGKIAMEGSLGLRRHSEKCALS